MSISVDEIWKHVWLTYNNWIKGEKWYFPVFSKFMEVKMEVNDLQSKIFFVIHVDDNQQLEAAFKISAFYLNY